MLVVKLKIDLDIERLKRFRANAQQYLALSPSEKYAVYLCEAVEPIVFAAIVFSFTRSIYLAIAYFIAMTLLKYPYLTHRSAKPWPQCINWATQSIKALTDIYQEENLRVDGTTDIEAAKVTLFGR